MSRSNDIFENTKTEAAPPLDSEPYLTSWCGGSGCNNCKLCLIFSGKAELVKADPKSLRLTYRIKEEAL